MYAIHITLATVDLLKIFLYKPNTSQFMLILKEVYIFVFSFCRAFPIAVTVILQAFSQINQTDFNTIGTNTTVSDIIGFSCTL